LSQLPSSQVLFVDDQIPPIIAVLASVDEAIAEFRRLVGTEVREKVSRASAVDARDG
jgi:hypothetical protein